MSYLLKHATRRPFLVRRSRRGVRVDERTLLNHSEFDGGAFVRVFVEDTSARRARRRIPEPRLRLRIGDCQNEIYLEFGVESQAQRENSLHKIDTLLGALHRFRDGLQAEADLHAERGARAGPQPKGGAMRYLKKHRTRRVAQWVALPDSTQVPNSAGGFAWAVDDWTRLGRFLVLGSEGGSYYANEWKLTRENAQAVERCLAEDGERTVAEIVRISEAGRAPKNDPALFALAMAAGADDERTRKAALEALPQVARTGTHLFRFAQFVEGFRGWGRSLRRAVGAWYASKPVDSIAYQAVKYRQRGGRDASRPPAARAPGRLRERRQPDALGLG